MNTIPSQPLLTEDAGAEEGSVFGCVSGDNVSIYYIIYARVRKVNEIVCTCEKK